MNRRTQALTRVAAGFLLGAGLFGLSSWTWENVVENWFVAAQEAKDVDKTVATWTAPDLTADIPVLAADPEPEEVFAVLRIPRFGDDYVRRIAETTNQKRVLDRLGVGHYEGTALPGEIGNFAVAGHRTTRGAAFMDLDLLQEGDKIYVQTKDGVYTYTVQYSKVVKPSYGAAIADVPEKPNEAATERWMTLTTCTPKYTAWNRLAVFAKFADFQRATPDGN